MVADHLREEESNRIGGVVKLQDIQDHSVNYVEEKALSFILKVIDVIQISVL